MRNSVEHEKSFITSDPGLKKVKTSVSISKVPQVCKLVVCDSATRYVFLFQNNHRNVDSSCKTGLDFWNCC